MSNFSDAVALTHEQHEYMLEYRWLYRLNMMHHDLMSQQLYDRLNHMAEHGNSLVLYVAIMEHPYIVVD